MAKFPEAENRRFHNRFACKRCKVVKRSTMSRILAKKLTCHKCGSSAFRPLRKK